jgi:OOP family OmpA-OmpF porin
MAGLKTRYKLALVGIAVVGGLFTVRAGMQKGWIPTPAAVRAFVPEKTQIATLGASIQQAPSQAYEVPAAPASTVPTRTLLTIPWQAAGSVILANGGPSGDATSLMTKFAGGNLKIERQDDYGKMQEQMLKFADGLSHGNPNPDGAGLVLIMGDGAPAFFYGLKSKLDAMHLHAVGFGVAGFSYGEDKCMAPDTGGDPNKAKGDVIAASPRDGDWNLCVKWAGDNNIPVNSDATAYDPGALNFVDVDSFTAADDKYISGACEDRSEVKAGVKTGKKVHVCVNGVATWTPGDVTVVAKRAATLSNPADPKSSSVPLVTLASTKDYDQQMPALIIGIKEDLDKNPAFATGLLRAIDRAAFQIRTTPDGVQKMAEAEAKVFGTSGGDEATPAYWVRFFNGFDSPDGKVMLGGSRVSTLGEVRDFFGLGSGTLNVYKGVYDVFGKYDVEYYPTAVPSVPKYEDIIDTDYITAALQGVTMGAPTATKFAEAKVISTAVSKKAVSIQFDTGKATIKSQSRALLVDLANQSGMTNLLIQIDGHTDNTGNSDANVSLSRQRAQSVADALTTMAPATFPANRMHVAGYGDTMPVADNGTDEGRAQNRRVEITFGR